jgi:hypothetical protein
LVERHTRYVMLVKVANKDTQSVVSALIKQAITQSPQPWPRSLLQPGPPAAPTASSYPTSNGHELEVSSVCPRWISSVELHGSAQMENRT